MVIEKDKEDIKPFLSQDLDSGLHGRLLEKETTPLYCWMPYEEIQALKKARY